MAAVKKGTAKGKRPPKKGLRGRMPSKRSINLILIDENKISVSKAVPAILLIVVLAAAFSKFLVADRLIAMSRASGQVASVQNTLNTATETLKQYEGIEDRYAHLTYKDMTPEELERVDRVQILRLVSTILPQGESTKSWSVTGNILTVEITGSSLEYLNQLARRIEESPIVDSCVIATATKNEQKKQNTVLDTSNQSLAGALENRRQAVEGGLADTVLSAMNNLLQPVESQEVEARFTIYLVQPPEGEEVEAADAADATEPQGAEPEAEPEATAEAGIEEPADAGAADAVPAEATDAQAQKPARPTHTESTNKPEATAEPTKAPEATAEPTKAPEVTATAEPTKAPEATAEPTKAPEATAEPTKAPEATAEPTKAPEVTAQSTQVPEAAPEMTAGSAAGATAGAEPTEEPEGEPEIIYGTEVDHIPNAADADGFAFFTRAESPSRLTRMASEAAPNGGQSEEVTAP